MWSLFLKFSGFEQIGEGGIPGLAAEGLLRQQRQGDGTAREQPVVVRPQGRARLPALVLPSQPAFPQELQVWDGLPTYPAESRPDLYFRLLYDPASWARTTDPFGSPALASRSIPGCVLTPSMGRGLPLSGSADHDVRQIGTTTFEISVVSLNGAIQFVNYTGGDGAILTAFELNFAEQGDPCRSEAEQVLGTLRSVSAIEATPPRGP